jgi:hypothetical protein
MYSPTNGSPNKMMQQQSYHLSIFGRPDTMSTMKLYKNLVKQFLILLRNQDEFQTIRSLIEDVFKLAKDAFFLRDFYRYTTRSVKNAVL